LFLYVQHTMKGMLILNVQFRRATVQDIEEIVKLCLELFKELGEARSGQEEALFKNEFKNSEMELFIKK
jgi:hypothetical protein